MTKDDIQKLIEKDPEHGKIILDAAKEMVLSGTPLSELGKKDLLTEAYHRIKNHAEMTGEEKLRESYMQEGDSEKRGRFETFLGTKKGKILSAVLLALIIIGLGASLVIGNMTKTRNENSNAEEQPGDYSDGGDEILYHELILTLPDNYLYSKGMGKKSGTKEIAVWINSDPASATKMIDIACYEGQAKNRTIKTKEDLESLIANEGIEYEETRIGDKVCLITAYDEKDAKKERAFFATDENLYTITFTRKEGEESDSNAVIGSIRISNKPLDAEGGLGGITYKLPDGYKEIRTINSDSEKSIIWFNDSYKSLTLVWDDRSERDLNSYYKETNIKSEIKKMGEATGLYTKFTYLGIDRYEYIFNEEGTFYIVRGDEKKDFDAFLETFKKGASAKEPEEKPVEKTEEKENDEGTDNND